MIFYLARTNVKQTIWFSSLRPRLIGLIVINMSDTHDPESPADVWQTDTESSVDDDMDFEVSDKE